jgi:predicted thioredoxin/glutaredoxin
MNSITDRITNDLFYRWYTIVTNEITDRMIYIFFNAFSIYKFIGDYIINGITEKIEIIDNKFSNDELCKILVVSNPMVNYTHIHLWYSYMVLCNATI